MYFKSSSFKKITSLANYFEIACQITHGKRERVLSLSPYSPISLLPDLLPAGLSRLSLLLRISLPFLLSRTSLHAMAAVFLEPSGAIRRDAIAPGPPRAGALASGESGRIPDQRPAASEVQAAAPGPGGAAVAQ